VENVLYMKGKKSLQREDMLFPGNSVVQREKPRLHVAYTEKKGRHSALEKKRTVRGGTARTRDPGNLVQGGITGRTVEKLNHEKKKIEKKEQARKWEYPEKRSSQRSRKDGTLRGNRPKTGRELDRGEGRRKPGSEKGLREGGIAFSAPPRENMEKNGLLNPKQAKNHHQARLKSDTQLQKTR